jgi:hypothetical protein
VVLMPKTTMNENDFAARLEDKVRLARKLISMQPETIS